MSQPAASIDALIAALAEIERYVTAEGWDQPVRLFALVSTARLIEAEPSLAGQLSGGMPDALSAIEQDDFHDGEDLVVALERISWPDEVAGCAVAMERSFLPLECEHEIPDDPVAAADFVSRHPRRQDVRVVVGALRGGLTHGLARLVTQPDDLLGADDLVPGLSAALLGTLGEGMD
ncbi:MAG: PPA1309 family protein [Propionibacteriaceae bacterium]|nr:PPA1309 family protein [Propionibacteriaceae bacterium]